MTVTLQKRAQKSCEMRSRIISVRATICFSNALEVCLRINRLLFILVLQVELYSLFKPLISRKKKKL